MGFIAGLPHSLIEAFKATLEETREADLLLHVIDAASESRDDHRVEVESVLREIDAGERPVLEIYNKIDLLEAEARIDRDETGKPIRVWLSAMQGAGLELLVEALAERLGEDLVCETVNLGPERARLRAASMPWRRSRKKPIATMAARSCGCACPAATGTAAGPRGTLIVADGGANPEQKRC